MYWLPVVDESQRVSPPNVVNSTSSKLLQLARDNDQTAWRQLLCVYGPVVRYWIRRAGVTPPDLGDVFQSTFLAVSRNLERFQPCAGRGSFRKWLKTITNSKVVDHYRKVGRRENADGGSVAARQLDAVPDPDESLSVEASDASDDSVIVRQVMLLIRGEFSESNWHAFWKTTVDGKTATEVAEEIGASPAGVRKAKSRVLARLRVAMEEYDP